MGHILSRTATQALSCLLFGSDVLSRTFSHLSFEERKTISRMREQKFSQSEIARRLGRDRATISREIRRNYWHDREFPDADGYWAMTANDMARDRRRVGKLFRREDLRTAVIGKLEAGWSPEQIAGRLKIEPKAKASICHETIYRYVYSPEGQQQQLARLLPERRRKRRPMSRRLLSEQAGSLCCSRTMIGSPDRSWTGLSTCSAPCPGMSGKV